MATVADALPLRPRQPLLAEMLPGQRTWLLAPAFILVGIMLVLPVAVVMVQSLRVDGAWSLHNYELFFARPHYIATLKTTFAVAAISTFLSIALAFPVCAFMATRSKRAVVVFVGCVMLSLALSGLVRTLSWQIVLSRSGPLNAILLWLGVLPRPVNMLFTRGAVVVGMVQILLPYAIALILSGMRRVDLEFVFAARSLGASAVGAFRSAYLPQIRRSLCSAALLVFVLATGFIITPALLGGTGEMMIGNVMLADLFSGSEEGTAMAATAGVVLSAALILATALAILAGGRAFNVRRVP